MTDNLARPAEALPLPNDPPANSDLPAGWVEPFNEIVTLLDAEAPGWTVAQVKEKFAHLNVYWDAPEGMAPERARELYERVDQIEQSTLRICEVCGQPGHMRTDRYYRRTLCEAHADRKTAPAEVTLRARESAAQPLNPNPQHPSA